MALLGIEDASSRSDFCASVTVSKSQYISERLASVLSSESCDVSSRVVSVIELGTEGEGRNCAEVHAPFPFNRDTDTSEGEMPVTVFSNSCGLFGFLACSEQVDDGRESITEGTEAV